MRLKLAALVVLMPIFCAIDASAHDRLVFAVDVIRHGDRTPIDEIPAAPHVWAEGLGQLTPKGMHQEFELGSKMRSAYVDQYHLLASRYTAGTLYVYSTDYDRTLMSAQSFLMGLYPPGTGPSLASGRSALPNAARPIPIHTIATEMNMSLVYDSDPEKFNDLMARYVFSIPEWKKKTDALRPQFVRWSQATGIVITNLNQLTSVGDTLYIHEIYHIALPSGLSADDARTIIDAGNWAFVTRFKPAEIGRITGRALLKTIADEIAQASQGKTLLRCVLFFAHDNTLLSQMSALGAPLAEAPPYAAHLHFALFDAGGKFFRIKVTYNDQPVAIPACGGSSCSLTQFMALANQQ